MIIVLKLVPFGEVACVYVYSVHPFHTLFRFSFQLSFFHISYYLCVFRETVNFTIINTNGVNYLLVT